MNIGDKVFLVPFGSGSVTEHTILETGAANTLASSWLLSNSPGQHDLGGNGYWSKSCVYPTFEAAKEAGVKYWLKGGLIFAAPAK